MSEALTSTSARSAPVVILSEEELRIAASIGIARQCQNLVAGRRDAYGADPKRGWSIHIEGAAGEMAVAKWRNRYWNGNLGDLKAADVGNVQVRTRSNDDYDLMLYKRDCDDDVFVLVTGLAPRFTLRGWIRARDGKRPEFWKDPAGGRPAFFVPQDVLRPMGAV